MKKIFNGAVILLFFGMALTIVEIACQKTVANVPVIGFDRLVYAKWTSAGYEYRSCNFDGSDDKKIPIQLPADCVIILGAPYGNIIQRSSDGQRFAFVVGNTSAESNVMTQIYSCRIDGTDLRLLKTNTSDPYAYYAI